MWYLFQDYQNTSNLLELFYFSSAILVSYVFALSICKKKNMDTKKIPIFATCCGVLVALLFGAIILNFFLVIIVSLLFTWLAIRKIE